MSNKWPAALGSFSFICEIKGDALCVKTRSGDVRRLKTNTPVRQRARFFDELFAEALPAGLPDARDGSRTSLNGVLV